VSSRAVDPDSAPQAALSYALGELAEARMIAKKAARKASLNQSFVKLPDMSYGEWAGDGSPFDSPWQDHIRSHGRRVTRATKQLIEQIDSALGSLR